METERPLSMLPSIKCSACGAEIQISAMGEHLCPTQQKEDAAESSRTYQKATPAALETQHLRQTANRPPTRPARIPLPRIDPAAANKTYHARQELLSPDGSMTSGRRTPMTPHTGRPGRSPAMRSVTSPSPSPRLPREASQELTGNMDSAFPPFPTTRSRSAARARTPGADPSYAAWSPMVNGGANVVRKLDTIAPGPFNAPARSSSTSTSANAGAQRPPAITVDQPPTERAASPMLTLASRPASPSQAPAPPALSRASSASAVSVNTNREGRPIPQRPLRPEPLDGFLAMLKSESEAAGRQRPTISGSFQHNNALPATSRPFQHTNTLPAISTGFVPALPPLPPAAVLRKLAHPVVHAPSDSASSASSTQSFRSDTSPPASASSSVSMLSITLGDLNDPSLLVPSLHIKSKQSNHHLSPEVACKPSPLAPEQQEERLDSPTEKMEPILHNSLAPFVHDFPESPVVPGFHPKRPLTPVSLASTPMASPPSEYAFPPRPASSKRATTSSKHLCRGCSEPIQGKSVKAADGRLTGRYHKHCFVCKTCHSAFATADFYVIDNNPYCEHHYHELNDSLCSHCDRGIEGPYLETQQTQKFHPSCFTCIDCHKPLRDDYFEISGKVYCEQHAFASVRRQEGPGAKRNMERRTTRFMVM